MVLRRERPGPGFHAFLLGTAAHLLFALVVLALGGPDAFIGPDSATYLRPAGELIQPGSSDPHRFLPRRLLGYPVLLGAVRVLFGESLLPVVVLQALGAGCAAWLALRIARAVTASPAAHAAAAAAAALSPNALAHSALVLTDSLHALLVLAGASAVLEAFRRRRQGGFLAGLLLWAAAQALRPTLHFVVVLLPLIVFGLGRAFDWRPRRSFVAAGALVLAAAPVAFVAGNHALDGVWTVSRTDETNARLLAACTLAAATGRDHRAIVEEWESQDRVLPSPIEVRRARLARVREVLSEHPILAARVAASNAVKTLLAPADGVYAFGGGPRARRPFLAALLAAGNVVGWILVIAGAARVGRDPSGRGWTLLALLLAGYIALISSPVGYQGARFRLPADLLSAPLLGAGLAATAARLRRSSAGARGTGASRTPAR